MESKQFDVLIIGAGAAGLIAALEIALTGRSVAVIEAKDRVGGRIATVTDKVFAIPVELGAEFVHGNLEHTQRLLKKAGIKSTKVAGSIWQHTNGHLQEQEDFIEDFSDLEKKFKELKSDLPVSAFLEQYLQGDKYEELRFSLQNYVEGYYAANTDKASTYSLCEELAKGDDEQYRIEGGYQKLVNYIEKECSQRGVKFFLAQPVRQLHWKNETVTAITENGNFNGTKVLITVPIGVLQNDAITFFPALPHIKQTAQQLGFGHVVKIILQFEDAFWAEKSLTEGKKLADMLFLFSEEAIPTWWTQHPQNVNTLTGWLGGPKAKTMNMVSSEEITTSALHSLSNIFRVDVSFLQQKLRGAHYYNWSADEFFSGAYSYEVVDGESAIKKLLQPIENTIFFAGEGLHHGPEIGTVEGALISGRDMAHQLIASFRL